MLHVGGAEHNLLQDRIIVKTIVFLVFFTIMVAIFVKVSILMGIYGTNSAYLGSDCIASGAVS